MGISKRPDMATVNVAVNLVEADTANSEQKTVVYAFSSGGKLLTQKAVDKKGVTSLTFPAGPETSGVRIVVGPEVDKGVTPITELTRRGAIERTVRIDPKTLGAKVELTVIPDIWRCWFSSRCFVKGKLLKQAETGGIRLDLPVSHATVEVYEVDPIPKLIFRLPDEIIEKIRDIIILPPPPPPPIWEGPIPPNPFDPVLSAKFGSAWLTGSPRALEAAQRPNIQPQLDTRVQPASRVAFNSGIIKKAALENMTSAAIRKDSFVVADDVMKLARSTNTAQFRQVLVDRPLIVRPILCQFFPTYVKMELVATAMTDGCGHFQTHFFRGCKGTDQPDLYFKAKQRLFGFFDVTIYAPTPISCHTHWNYACGTEVTLYTKHPLALTSSPCKPIVAPDDWVLVMAIGNRPLSLVRGTSTTLQPSTNSTNIGLTDGNAPFGGLLRFRLEFDNNLRDNLGVKYYQMSYRKGNSGTFTPMIGECHRHYTHEIGDDLVLEVFPLGPKVVNSTPNLFEIPPALPPVGQWSYPDLLEDLTSAKFATTDIAPFAAPGVAWSEHGKYQVKVDLFDVNGAPVNIATKGIKYRVPTSTDLSGTINTADAAGLGLVSGNSFIMTLHVDNSRCSANVEAPNIGGTEADDCCGVLNYTPGNLVTMDWQAVHPNQFATYSFNVVRGIQPVYSQSGPVGAGLFSTTQSVNTLMTANPAPGCDDVCTVAGFSQGLYVAATATDGWGRLSNYDASMPRAFVLSPEE